jgi:prefoldin subunit 5
MMFGFVTKAKHEAALAYERGLADQRRLEAEALQRQVDSYADRIASLQGELDHLRPLAQKHLNSLAALKQNKGRKA